MTKQIIALVIFGLVFYFIYKIAGIEVMLAAVSANICVSLAYIHDYLEKLTKK